MNQLSVLTLIFLLSRVHAVPFVENTDFDNKIEEIVKNQYAGDPSFLQKFLCVSGDPKGLRNKTNYQNPAYCLDINEDVIFDEKYSDCIVLESLRNRTVLQLTKISPFGIFRFIVNLVSLKNIELELKHHNELVYLYFSAFEKCDNCLFNIVMNRGVHGVKFAHLFDGDISTVPYEYRPRLYIRGNAQLKLNDIKTGRLTRICHKEMCVIQNSQECYFHRPIRNEDQYKDCKFVYGDMTFNQRFQTIQPTPPNFVIDGCFTFNNTGIRFIRPFLKAIADCSKQHVFENNRYMCTDQLDELARHWGRDKVKVISNYSEVNCYQGECRGGFISERTEQRYSGCEIVQGDIHFTAKSDNMSDRVRELSYIHLINGRLHMQDNPTVTDLPFPFLRHIRSEKCPALSIVNMTNLRNIIFHPNVEFHCNTSGPVVVIKNAPKLLLFKQMLRQMKANTHQFEEFDYNLTNYGLDVVTWILLACSLAVVAMAELFLALRHAYLLPNFIYRKYPMDVRRAETPRREPEEDAE